MEIMVRERIHYLFVGSNLIPSLPTIAVDGRSRWSRDRNPRDYPTLLTGREFLKGMDQRSAFPSRTC